MQAVTAIALGILSCACCLAAEHEDSREVTCRNADRLSNELFMATSGTLQGVADWSSVRLFCPQSYDAMRRSDYVDQETAQVLDGWRRPMMLIVIDGAVSGFGSAGPDGVWEGGRGDDILRLVNASTATPSANDEDVQFRWLFAMSNVVVIVFFGFLGFVAGSRGHSGSTSPNKGAAA